MRRNAAIGGGNAAIDGRTRAGRAAKRLENSLIAAIGDPTPQKAILARLAAREAVLIEQVDSELLRSPDGAAKRRRAYLAMLADRQRLAAALTRHLTMLGLDRVEQTPSLAEYLASRTDSEVE
jgi:hypothetical protein